MKRIAMFLVVFAAALSLIHSVYAGPKEEETAKLLTDYLVKARAVLATNQSLINNAELGDKGFTPQAYEQQMVDDFKKMSGKDLKALTTTDPANKALLQLHESAKETIADAQAQINEKGKGFKGFSPAIFGKKTSDKFLKKSGIAIKQTSLKNRGAYNAPDEFEKRILKKFEAPDWEKMKPYTETVTENAKKAVRHMFPLYISNACLVCHGDPAGETDIAGRKKEGYKVGEVRGAISVIVPVK